jgi:hypothetical protein
MEDWRRLVVSRYTPGEPLQPEECRVEIHATVPTVVQVGRQFRVECRITNRGKAPLVSAPPHPVHLSYKWLDPTTQRQLPGIEGRRSRLTPELLPGRSIRQTIIVRAPTQQGELVLRVTLVQETVAWFDDLDSGNHESHVLNLVEAVQSETRKQGLNSVELISMHLPKAAGSSLRDMLLAHFGENDIHLDYNDNPADPRTMFHIDPVGFDIACSSGADLELDGKRAVHGHFHPNKYMTIGGAKRVTFLREPVSRLLSHYFFWQALPEPPARSGSPLHTYMLRHRLSILEFAKLPIIQRFMTGVFFKGVDMTAFDFIGRQENFSSDFEYLSRLINLSGGTDVRINDNPTTGYQDVVKQDVLDKLGSILAEDIDFYKRWAGYGIK